MIVLDTNLVSVWIGRGKKFPTAFQYVDELLKTETLSISSVTQYELRRGLELLRLRGEGRTKLVTYEKFIERVEVLGLDGPGGGGWNVAARLWAASRAQKPSIVIQEADILVAATAAYHNRPLATGDAKLVNHLSKIGFSSEVRHVAMV